MNEIDFYSGFEGEAEIILIEKDKDMKDVFILRIWFGDFSEILETIPVGDDGYYHGVPYYYSLNEGWYDEDLWECKDKELFLNQLSKIPNVSLNERQNSIKSHLIKLIQNCILNGNNLYFRYD